MQSQKYYRVSDDAEGVENVVDETQYIASSYTGQCCGRR
jgi:hypothetical protein